MMVPSLGPKVFLLFVFVTWRLGLGLLVPNLKVELFIWMQNKFQPVNLMEQRAALARKESASAMIKLGLEESERLKIDHCYVKRDATIRKKWEQSQSKSKEDDQGLEDLEGEGLDGEDSNEDSTLRSFL